MKTGIDEKIVVHTRENVIPAEILVRIVIYNPGHILQLNPKIDIEAITRKNFLLSNITEDESDLETADFDDKFIQELV